MLKWPQRATRAIVQLFRPLQDIDIYVEDAGSERFYGELFKRIAPDELRIKRVFPLHGRANVLAQAQLHDCAKRPALFLIDGDFEWVRGEPSPPNVYRLESYCIENLLISEHAAVQLIFEEGVLSKPESSEALDFASWQKSLQPLVELFTVYAALNAIDPSTATVSIGLGGLLSPAAKGKPPELDPVKTEARIVAQKQRLSKLMGEAKSVQFLATIRARVTTLPVHLYIVSGKDFLLPLFHFKLKSCGCGLTVKSLRMRLARHCDVTLLRGLTGALVRAARP